MTTRHALTMRSGRPAESTALSELIDRAFFDLDANAYLVPRTADRTTVMRRYFRLHVEHALTSPHGTVDVAVDASDRPVGVAIWSTHTDPGPHDYEARLADAAPPDLLDRFRTFEELMHRPQPATPHHYLGFLAVQPTLQSRGVGTALLDAGHTRLDAAGQPGWLVASGARSRELYARHGYERLGPDVVLPTRSRMYPMVRT